MRTLVDLSAEKYISVTTFRKDGRAVSTPIWVVADGEAIAVWTRADSGKIKRIRRNGKVTVAPCTYRGEITGESVEGWARLGDSADTERIRKALGRKYGLLGRLTVWGSKKRFGADATIAVLITLKSDE